LFRPEILEHAPGLAASPRCADILRWKEWVVSLAPRQTIKGYAVAATMLAASSADIGGPTTG
jgi:hypothetical protein